jgi:hypothetical protein
MEGEQGNAQSENVIFWKKKFSVYTVKWLCTIWTALTDELHGAVSTLNGMKINKYIIIIIIIIIIMLKMVKISLGLIN